MLGGVERSRSSIVVQPDIAMALPTRSVTSSCRGAPAVPLAPKFNLRASRCPQPLSFRQSIRMQSQSGTWPSEPADTSQDGSKVAAKPWRSQQQQALMPFLVEAPKRGVVGSSRYADRLRKEVVKAARDPARGNVLVFGEPGLDKGTLASLIHFGGPSRETPLARLDCARLDAAGAELFGRGSKPGLLSMVSELQGTLLLNNVHKAPAALLPRLKQLLQDGTYYRSPTFGSINAALAIHDSVDMSDLLHSKARILMTAEKWVTELDGLAAVIKVPPLRVRPGDVKDLQRYFLHRLSRASGAGEMTLTPEALRHIQAYTWPGNLQELEAMVERAAIQTAGGDRKVASDVFWFATEAKDRFRWDMLRGYEPLRQLVRSKVWPDTINFGFTAYVFPVIVAILLWGPQDRDHNFVLNIFWDYWWPLIMVSYLFLGRVWCAVCPFMIYGELVQKWRLSQGAVLLKWPRDAGEKYGAWFLFALFGGILVWEEVWDLNNTAALSGWLLILITSGAMVCSWFFERRLWCRYLCPIGGMNGMFAKLSMTELRARQGVCSGTCTTYSCYKGGPAAPPNGLDSPGCPIYSHPAQLVDNRNCTLCMECVKACPHGSVEFRLRPPGIDLWTSHVPTSSELALMFMLLGAVYVHHMPALLSDQLGVASPAGVSLAHIGATIVLLAIPGAIAWGADRASRATASILTDKAGGGGASAAPPPPAPFVSLAYGYLPLAWAATLAHYLDALLLEAGSVLPVAAATFGWEDSPLPRFAADPAVVSFLQGTCLLAGAAMSLVLSRKLAGQPWRAIWPQCATILGLTAELWWLLV